MCTFKMSNSLINTLWSFQKKSWFLNCGTFCKSGCQDSQGSHSRSSSSGPPLQRRWWAGAAVGSLCNSHGWRRWTGRISRSLSGSFWEAPRWSASSWSGDFLFPCCAQKVCHNFDRRRKELWIKLNVEPWSQFFVGHYIDLPKTGRRCGTRSFLSYAVDSLWGRQIHFLCRRYSFVYRFCADSVQTLEVLITKGRYEDDGIVIHVHVKGMVLPMNNLPSNSKRWFSPHKGIDCWCHL